jgi:UDP-N-acetylmuramoylalanine--D-glutamate ligase
MRNREYFKDKKITVLGLARSGLACANLLYELGAQVSVTDIQDNAQTRSNAAQLKSPAIKVELGAHTRPFIAGRDLIVVSPGIPDSSMAIVWAMEASIPLISEIECAFMLCSGQVIAVTGSNGKTTVTTLIGRLLEASGRKAHVLGNIGTPFCSEVARIQEGDYVSLEVSSFQLEKIRTFKPKIAVLLNFSRNHLDRYRDMDEYLQAKKRIFLNQDITDYAVLNQEDSVVRGLGSGLRSTAVYFKAGAGLNPNQAAVMAVGSILGINQEVAHGVFKAFRGVEHRMEYVSEIRRVKFINDSKATTVDAALWALRSSAGPVILIAGGRDKGNDYRLMLEVARQKVKGVVAIGESRQKIKDSLGEYLPTEEASSLEDAVKKALSMASPGDCVLLSPMCSSFDMFRDYEDRGRAFKRIVGALAESSG